MNSSFYIHNFEKFYKTAREAFPTQHDPEQITAERNKSVEESSSEATSTFSPLAAVNSVPLSLNTEAA